MSMNNQAGVIHPRVISLSNKIDEIYQLLVRKHYRKATEHMFFVLMELKPGDKAPDLFEKLKTEIKILNSLQFKSGINNRISNMDHHYWEWYEQLNTLLHTKGYFSGNAYRPFTPSEDMPQQNPKPIQKNYDERLRSDLE